MRAFAVVGALVVSVLASHAAPAAETASPDRDRLKVNPIDVPEVQEEKDAGDAIVDYFKARGRDLADILTLKLGWGTDMSLGFQLRAIRPIQVGAGVFEGYQLAIDRGCIGVMKEAEMEGGISIFYPSWIARKVLWQTDEAKKRNVFFGDVGEKGELKAEDMPLYDDENQGWFTTTAQVQLPYLPKVEATVNWGEIPDFVLSLFHIGRFRVPPAFHKQDGPGGKGGERIPAPSIFWHGQEKYEKYD